MTRARQLTPQLDSEHVLQMDIQYEAGGIVQVRAFEKAFSTAEDLCLESMELQHPLHRPQDTWIIVDNDDPMARAQS